MALTATQPHATYRWSNPLSLTPRTECAGGGDFLHVRSALSLRFLVTCYGGHFEHNDISSTL